MWDVKTLDDKYHKPPMPKNSQSAQRSISNGTKQTFGHPILSQCYHKVQSYVGSGYLTKT